VNLRRTLIMGTATLLVLPVAETARAVRRGAARTQRIDMVVIHSTGGPTCDENTGRPIWVKAGTMDDNIRQIEAHPRLGIHYMIDRDGTLRASVPEEHVAHHVFSHSRRSIAIELINDGDGVDPFPEPQLKALVALLRDIVARRGLPRNAIVRHSDLDRAMLACDRSQRRKVDPGAAYPHELVLDRVFQRP
jgi:N-acetylmuramoyl-L-alanine amidase